MTVRLPVLCAVALLGALAAPLFFMLAASLVDESVLASGAFRLEAMTLDNFAALFSRRRIWLPMLNSVMVAGATTVLCLVLGTMCAYAVARLAFRGRDLLLAGVLMVAMFPQITIVSPLYLLLRASGLINTVPGLVVPYLTFAMPLTIWLLTGVFRQLPAEVEEAARVDGARLPRILWEIVLPLAAPGIAASGVVTFIYCWNEFLFALAFTFDATHRTLPVAVALFRGQYQVPWGEILAAAVLATLPVAAVAALFQRRIVGGLSSGAVKG